MLKKVLLVCFVAAMGAFHSTAVCAKTFMIAVGGGSGSGKTTLANKLAEELRKFGEVKILSQDYYLEPSDGLLNSYDPSALSWDRMKTDLSKIRQGEIEIPCVDPIELECKGELKLEPLNQSPQQEKDCYVILVGSHSLNPEIHAYFDFNIYVHTKKMLRMERVELKAEKRCHGKEDIHSCLVQMDQIFKDHVAPTMGLANQVVPGDAPVEASVRTILLKLEERVALDDSTDSFGNRISNKEKSEPAGSLSPNGVIGSYNPTKNRSHL